MPPNPTVAERAEALGKDPVELMIDLALESDFEQFFVQAIANRDPDHLLAVTDDVAFTLPAIPPRIGT